VPKESDEDIDGAANSIAYYVNSEKGASFYAYDTRPNEDRLNNKYRVNDRVRITIPNGDYTARKIIEGYAI